MRRSSLPTSSSLIWTRSLIAVPSSMKSSDSTSKEPVCCRRRRAKSLSMSLTASSALLWNMNAKAVVVQHQQYLLVLLLFRITRLCGWKSMKEKQLPECIPCRPGPRVTRSCQSTHPPAGCLSDWLPPELAGLTGCHGDYESQSSLGTGPEPSGLQLQLIWRQREKAREESSGEKRQREKHYGKWG